MPSVIHRTLLIVSMVSFVTDVRDGMRAHAPLEMEPDRKVSLHTLGSANASSSKVPSVTGQSLSCRLTMLESGANEEMRPAVDTVVAKPNTRSSSSGLLRI